MLAITIKRGDTYIFDGQVKMVEGETETPQDITGWTINSEIRFSGRLVARCQVDVIDAELGKYRISVPDGTDDWPARTLEQDIEYISPQNQVISSDTFTIEVVKDITRPVDPT